MKLGALIRALKALPAEYEIRYDFCGLLPTTMASYRGYYDQLALGHRYHDYDKTDPTVGTLLAEAQSALGKTFCGWKGGDYEMREHTSVWVDNPGECFGVQIVAVHDTGYSAVILTQWSDQ